MDDTTAGELGRAQRALPGSAGALLAVRLGAAAPDLAEYLAQSLARPLLSIGLTLVPGMMVSCLPISEAAISASVPPNRNGAEGPNPLQAPAPCHSSPAINEAGSAASPMAALYNP